MLEKDPAHRYNSARELMRDFPGLPVHNLHHNARPTAELAIGLLFAVAKSTERLGQSFRRIELLSVVIGFPVLWSLTVKVAL